MIFPLIALLVLVACGTRETPSASSVPTLADTATPLPEVEDVPIYQNSFESITDLAASG